MKTSVRFYTEIEEIEEASDEDDTSAIPTTTASTQDRMDDEDTIGFAYTTILSDDPEEIENQIKECDYLGITVTQVGDTVRLLRTSNRFPVGFDVKANYAYLDPLERCVVYYIDRNKMGMFDFSPVQRSKGGFKHIEAHFDSLSYRNSPSGRLYLFFMAGQIGVHTVNWEVESVNRYDSIGEFQNRYHAVVKVGQKYGIIREKGELILHPRYDAVELRPYKPPVSTRFHSETKESFVIKKEGKFGLMGFPESNKKRRVSTRAPKRPKLKWLIPAKFESKALLEAHEEELKEKAAQKRRR